MRHVAAGFVSELHQITFAQQHRLVHVTGANLRAFDVHHQRDLAADVLTNLAYAGHRFMKPLVAGMCHVKATDVHTLRDQIGQHFFAGGGRADGKDDFCLTSFLQHEDNPVRSHVIMT